MKHTSRSLAVLAALFAPAVAFAQPEVEPNNSIGTAGSPTGVPVVRTGLISPGTDMDFYAVTVPSGTALRIRATPTGSHTCNTADLTLTFLRANGTTVAFNDDGGMMFCPDLNPEIVPEMTNLPAGTYYINVGNLQTNVTNIAYSLTVDVIDMPRSISPVFTYQGRLQENEAEVNGPRDFTVTLWNHLTGTLPMNQVGTPIQLNNIDVNNGLFTLPLDFGTTAFNGDERYAEIRVGYSGQGTGTLVGPRQRLTPTPHAVYAMKAGLANTATNADYATAAGTAGTANNALSADVANSAWQTPWNGITGMPPVFADGNDDDGPWSKNGNMLYYTTAGVCIGATNPGAFTFAVSGTAAKTGGGSWAVFCDSRLKHDIRPMSGTLDKLLGLRGYTYEYNANAIQNRLALPGTQIGLMAEEVERVFPDWVAKDADGYRYVTERATTALMVEALRDLRAEKDKAIAEKQAQIDALNARLDRLEKAMQK